MARPKKQTTQTETKTAGVASDAPTKARARYVFAPHKHPDYPDGPDLDPQFGDRTPAFVTWLAARNQKQPKQTEQNGNTNTDTDTNV